MICESDCYQENRNHNYTFLPFTIRLLSAAYWGETEEKSEQTPPSQKRKLPFLLSRAAEAAKRKAQTEVARAERCKRRLFSSETDKENIPTSAEPRILPQKSRETQITDEIVSIKCGVWLFHWHLIWVFFFFLFFEKSNKSGHKILFQQLPDTVRYSKTKELSGLESLILISFNSL